MWPFSLRSKEVVRDRVFIYVFRDKHFAPAGDTVVSAAPADAVKAVYGGGGIKGAGGLSAAFGGSAAFRDDTTGDYYLGVWGARKAAKFRNALKESGMKIEVIKAPPPGRLAWFSTDNSEKRKERQKRRIIASKKQSGDL